MEVKGHSAEDIAWKNFKDGISVRESNLNLKVGMQVVHCEEMIPILFYLGQRLPEEKPWKPIQWAKLIVKPL